MSDKYDVDVLGIRKVVDSGGQPAEYLQSVVSEKLAGWKLDAEQGNANAQYLYGQCLYDGVGVEEDKEQAFQWLEKSSAQGNALAQCKLGICYLNGFGVAQNIDKAADCFERSAAQGFVYAMFTLGYFYQNVSENLECAIVWYGKAANAGHHESALSLGVCCQLAGDIEHAASIFEVLANKGDPRAMFNLASLLSVDPENKEVQACAQEWYMKAAQQGYELAQLAVGDRLRDGYGVEQDVKRARAWFCEMANNGSLSAVYRLAQMGDMQAQYHMGTLCHEGKGVEQSIEEAEKWYRQAAEQGMPEAQHNLAWCLIYLQKNDENLEEIAGWYQKAAEQGLAMAQYELGMCYKRGRGVEQNSELGDEWWKKAAAQGHPDAMILTGDASGHEKTDALMKGVRTIMPRGE